jgi:hypothetical protein
MDELAKGARAAETLSTEEAMPKKGKPPKERKPEDYTEAPENSHELQ